ncbi:MAG: AMP-binding protein [Methylacidiphilales bacterium]|nr:AMP-binding protein [Candidatus Methylacidiphilales bacterium]
MPTCLWSRFSVLVEQFPENDAFFIDGKEHITYSKLQYRVVRLARFLQEKGVATTSKVLLQCESPVSMTSLILACDLLGAKVMIGSLSHGVHGLDACLKTYKPNVVIHDSLKINRVLGERVVKQATGTTIEWLDTANYWGMLEPFSPLDFSDHIERSSSIQFISNKSNDSEVFMFEAEIEQLIANAGRVCEFYNINPLTRIFHTMDWNSRVGLFVLFHGFCLTGATAIISTDFSYRDKIKQITHADLYLDNALHITELIEDELIQNLKIERIPETFICVCGRLALSYQMRFYREFKTKIFISFGKSNFGFIATTTLHDDKPSLLTFTKVLSEYEFKFNPIDNPPVRDEWSPHSRTIGELIMVDKDTKKETASGIIATVIGTTLHCYGSLQNLPELHQLRISEIDLENYIMLMPSIVNCIVIMVPHPHHGAVPIALVIFSSELETFNSDLLRGVMYGKITCYKIPKKFIQLPSFRYDKWGEVDRLFYQSHYSDLYQHLVG